MFYDGNANLKQFFNRRLTKKRKREGGGEEGVEREKRQKEREREELIPRGALTRKIPAIVEQFYLQLLNEILRNVSSELVNRTAESIVL